MDRTGWYTPMQWFIWRLVHGIGHLWFGAVLQEQLVWQQHDVCACARANDIQIVNTCIVCVHSMYEIICGHCRAPFAAYTARLVPFPFAIAITFVFGVIPSKDCAPATQFKPLWAVIPPKWHVESAYHDGVLQIISHSHIKMGAHIEWNWNQGRPMSAVGAGTWIGAHSLSVWWPPSLRQYASTWQISWMHHTMYKCEAKFILWIVNIPKH